MSAPEPQKWDRFKKFGNRFLFELAMEYAHDDIIKSLRTYLGNYSVDQIREMVKVGKFPYVLPEAFEQASGYAEYLEGIAEIRLMEALMEARPDIGLALEDMGEAGAIYVVQLRAHLLDMVKHPEKAALQIPSTPAALKSTDLVKASCDSCGKSWPVARAEVDKIAACPFCGKGKDDA